MTGLALRGFLTGFFVFSVFVLPISAGAFDFIVVSGGAISSISADDLKSLYLGVKKDINGISPKLYISREPSARESFFKFLGVDETKFQKLWLMKALSGEATPPEGLSTDEIIKRMESEKNAIGIIPKNTTVGLMVIFK